MMFYGPLPFFPFQQQPPNNNRPRKRPGRKERQMTKNFMEFIRDHEKVHAEYQDWLKSKEKKDEKKKGEVNTRGLAMFLVAATPFIGLFWLYVATQIIVSSYQSLSPILQHIK